MDGCYRSALARRDRRRSCPRAERPPSPLARLAAALALDPPAVQLVELLVAAEIDPALAERCAPTHGVPLALARRLLPDLDPADLALAAPLRTHEILRLADAPRSLAALRLGEAALDRLLGGTAIDPALAPAARTVTPADEAPADLTRALATALGERGPDGLSPLIALTGADPATAAAALAELGLAPHRLLPAALPSDPAERARWSRLWGLDAALGDASLIVPAAADAATLADMLDPLIGHVILLGDAPADAFARALRPLAFIDPGLDARRWERAFGARLTRRLGPALGGAARRIRLAAPDLARVARETAPALVAEPDSSAATRLLWRAAARAIPPVAVPGVLRREPAATWDDLILPPPIADSLGRLEGHVRHAEQVMGAWGFAQRMSGRGIGIDALFAGPSGTGKTLAAEVLAHALGLPMLTIDLAQLTSKLIGETSKNIAAAFAEAERTGAVMIWNEGDAVFGARGQVSNATDRHVNAEVGDLLQRIETFPGFTIVTTNLKSAIDIAFLRRFRFVVDFPMPSEIERRAIWARAFPPAAPLALASAGLDALARVALSGGAIRNAALGAAFLAAEAQAPIDLTMIADALAAELAKTGQPMPALSTRTEGEA